ncbi:MAG: hypothetical protein ACE5HE_14335 [Phycisphaerae bacterium]
MDRETLEARREAIAKQVDQTRAMLLRLQGALAVLDDLLKDDGGEGKDNGEKH